MASSVCPILECIHSYREHLTKRERTLWGASTRVNLSRALVSPAVCVHQEDGRFLWIMPYDHLRIYLAIDVAAIFEDDQVRLIGKIVDLVTRT
jgi:hypothetical protein